MKVVIRTDASIQIGTGHVMRCLTLADALRKKGADVQFICRKHVGNLITYIESKCFQVHVLETIRATSTSSTKIECEDESQLFHANWLGVTQENDAQECKPIMQKIQSDWLVVDHYAIDRVWQSELKGFYQKLMVIDDLADRSHQCDLLLDQTYGRLQQDYQGLVPVCCQMLVGSEYALLRPEFAEWREYSLKRRVVPEFKHLLITMGGVDQHNVTCMVLNALMTCDLSRDLEITVVMGSNAPHLAMVIAQAENMLNKIKIKVSVNNMAEIMANADLAIGAAGATTWERCCLGLPSVLMVLADNQKDIASLISVAGAAIKLELSELGGLCCSIDEAENNFGTIISNSALITDGNGVNHIVENIL